MARNGPLGDSPRGEYQPDEFPDWPEQPWHFPGILWRVPWWPLRVYLHAGDKMLFRLWWLSRRPMWALADLFNEDRVAQRIRERRSGPAGRSGLHPRRARAANELGERRP